MNLFGGSGSVHRLASGGPRREAFANEQDRNPKADREWLRPKRDELCRVLGYFIGEPPINPFDPAAPIATAPP